MESLYQFLQILHIYNVKLRSKFLQGVKFCCAELYSYIQLKRSIFNSTEKFCYFNVERQFYMVLIKDEITFDFC